jgi:hypothetical protein
VNDRLEQVRRRVQNSEWAVGRREILSTLATIRAEILRGVFP